MGSSKWENLAVVKLRTNADQYFVLRPVPFCTLLFRIDKKIADHFHRNTTCCGKKIHRGNFPRKPRGIPEEVEELFNYRFSFNCQVRNCRIRYTPISLRFCGRKVYVGLVAILHQYPALNYFLSLLYSSMSIRPSPITIKRWAMWWEKDLPMSKIWIDLGGQVPANTTKAPIVNFLMSIFLQKFNTDAKALFKTIFFLGPISVPDNYPPFFSHKLCEKKKPQNLFLENSKISPYLQRSD